MGYLLVVENLQLEQIQKGYFQNKISNVASKTKRY